MKPTPKFLDFFIILTILGLLYSIFVTVTLHPTSVLMSFQNETKVVVLPRHQSQRKVKAIVKGKNGEPLIKEPIPKNPDEMAVNRFYWEKLSHVSTFSNSIRCCCSVNDQFFRPRFLMRQLMFQGSWLLINVPKCWPKMSLYRWLIAFWPIKWTNVKSISNQNAISFKSSTLLPP